MRTIPRASRVALAILATAALPAGVWAQVNPNLQTAAPSRRGYPEGTFPRLQKIADGVYTYQALRNAARGEQMTTNSFIVITSEGVLVADGQGNLAETQKMVDKI